MVFIHNLPYQKTKYHPIKSVADYIFFNKDFLAISSLSALMTIKKACLKVFRKRCIPAHPPHKKL